MSKHRCVEKEGRLPVRALKSGRAAATVGRAGSHSTYDRPTEHLSVNKRIYFSR